MVRKLLAKDRGDFLRLLKENFGRLDESEFDKVIQDPNYICFVYEEEGKVVSFITLLLVDELGEIVEVATDAEYRRKGYALKLIEYALDCIKKMQKIGMHLEVRKSNLPAISLYNKLGFREIYIRKNYYGGGEDGIVMQLRF